MRTLKLLKQSRKYLCSLYQKGLTDHSEQYGYEGYYVFDPDSILIFNPITADDLSKSLQVNIKFHQFTYHIKIDGNKYVALYKTIKNQKKFIGDYKDSIDVDCVPKLINN